jgi:hypothetical protein
VIGSVLLRRRKLVALVVAIPTLVVATLSYGMASASACHPVIQAEADCTAHISFTASAWTGDGATNDTRTNNSVDVLYSTNGEQGPFTSIRGADAGTPDGEKYVFNQANNFQFSDSFVLPSNVTRPANIELRSIALDKWGVNENIDAANRTADVSVAVPAACAVPSATITAPTCTVTTAQVVLTNAGQEPVQFRLFKDNDVTPFESFEVGSGSKTVSVSVPNSFLLSVHAGNMPEVQQQVAPATGCVQPEATAVSTASNVCATDASGWTLTFNNSAETNPETFVVKDNLGNAVDSTVVPPGQTVSKTYAFTKVTGTSLQVSVNNKVLTTTDNESACVNVTASVDASCNTAAGSGALLSFTNTGKVSEIFTVVRDGKSVQGSPFTLAPSSLVTWKLLPMANGQTADIKVTGNNGLSLEKSVTLTCAIAASATTPPTVLGESITRSDLATTGIDLTPLMTLGTILFGLGITFLYVSARFSFIYGGGSDRSVITGMHFDPDFKGLIDQTRGWCNGLVAPKGRHSRRS